MNKNIHESKEICNRLRENNLMDAISEYALGYIGSILITAFSYGYRGKTVDIARNSDRHRTSISRFLRYEKWNDRALEEAIKTWLPTLFTKNHGKAVYQFYSLWMIPYPPKAYHHRKRLTRLSL